MQSSCFFYAMFIFFLCSVYAFFMQGVYIFFIQCLHFFYTVFIFFSCSVYAFFLHYTGKSMTEICDHFNWQYSISIEQAYREQDDKKEIYLSDLVTISEKLFWNEKTLKYIVQPIILDHVKPQMLNWSKLYFRLPHYGYAGDGTFGWCNQLVSKQNS